MFTDYITLMLMNMVAGLVIVALFFFRGLTGSHPKHWAPPLAAVGLVAFAVGLHMTLTWPVTQAGGVNLRWANVAFGELTVLFGALYLAAALAVGKGWDLLPLGVFAAVGGAVAIFVGLTMIGQGLSRSPALSGAGFILAGLGGVLTPVVVGLRKRLLVRAAAAAVLIGAAIIFTIIGLGAYHGHLVRFSGKLG